MSDNDSNVVKLVPMGSVSGEVERELLKLAQSSLERVVSGEVVGMAVVLLLSDGETQNGYYVPDVVPVIGELQIINSELIQHRVEN